MPKLTFASKDAIPEGLGEFATEDNGKYVVEVSPTTKLNEFRDNNVKYLRERDEAVAKLTTYTKTFGEDIAAVSAELTDLRATSQLVKDGKFQFVYIFATTPLKGATGSAGAPIAVT